MSDEEKTRIKKRIRTYADKCAGCISCQLVCSFTYTNSFNPARSRIVVNYIGDTERSICFTGECIQCGICADYCNYGALELIEEPFK
jgi:carbon-monoxide dehydrogenase iron sulfur subunit